MSASLIRRALIRLDDYRSGDKRLHYLPEVERECLLSSKELRSRQWDRLLRILDLAYQQVPFYRRRFQEAGITPDSIQAPSDLLTIPLLTREDLRGHQKELINPSIRSDELFESATGGTTDSPVHLALDRECLARRRACTVYFQRWMGFNLGDRMALLWCASQDAPKATSFKGQVRDWLLGKSLFLWGGYLNDQIMQEHYAKLKEFRPDVLQAFPTPLYLFACFLERNNLRVPIQHINVAAEYLYEFQREKIEAVFSTKIFNWYGARDLGHLATECHVHRGMHINSYGLYMEVIKDGKQVEEETGEIVVTELFNRAMPLIRYKNGDLGAISYRTCPCGSALPLLEDVGGRYVDSFKKRDGTIVPGISFPNRIIKECLGIEKLQIVQKNFEHFQLNIVKGISFTEGEVEKLKERVCDFMRERLTFDVVFVDDILPERSGKVTFCKSEVGRAPASTREEIHYRPI